MSKDNLNWLDPLPSPRPTSLREEHQQQHLRQELTTADRWKVAFIAHELQELREENSRLEQENRALRHQLSSLQQDEGYPKPCRAAFEELAQHNPDRLVRWIYSLSLSNAHLSFAIEELGRKSPASEAKRAKQIALNHLRHPSALVREGAVYALEGFREDEEVRAKLREIKSSDPSQGVRDAITEVLIA